MRTLNYVPIIHTSADLGSLAEEVSKRGIAVIGNEVWHEHLKTIEGFWESILNYFDSINVSGLKIYQDGMVAEGETAQKMLEEGVRLGSRNYQLLANLLERGAILVKTEDFKFVKEERNRLVAMTQTKSIVQKIIALIKYKLVKNILLNKRDKFIAQKIDETLKHERQEPFLLVPITISRRDFR